MPRLSSDERNQALGMLEAGASQLMVAGRFGCSVRTVQELQRRHRETGAVIDRPRSGRPCITSERDDRYIRLSHPRDHRLTAVQTARHLQAVRRIHPQTVRNRLREAGLRSRCPAIRTILDQVHRRRRLDWCRRHQRMTLGWWRRVAFSDESRFSVSRSDGRTRVYRRNGE
jgi:transposase